MQTTDCEIRFLVGAGRRNAEESQGRDIPFCPVQNKQITEDAEDSVVTY